MTYDTWKHRDRKRAKLCGNDECAWHAGISCEDYDNMQAPKPLVGFDGLPLANTNAKWLNPANIETNGETWDSDSNVIEGN